MKGAVLALLPLLAVATPVIRTDRFADSDSYSHESIHGDSAPLLSSVEAKEIPDSYIVVFKDHVDHSKASNHHAWVQDLHLNVQTNKNELRKRSQSSFADSVYDGLKHTYNIGGSLMGYSGHFDEDVIEAVRKHPDVSLSNHHSLTV